jgi:hypothetical protein
MQPAPAVLSTTPQLSDPPHETTMQAGSKQHARSLLERGWTAEQVRAALGLTRRQIDHLLAPLSDSAAIPDDPFWRARRAARRCPGCGGLVFHWPCLACELRAREGRETELRRAA